MQISKLIGRLIAWLGRACLVLVLVLIALYYMAFAIKVFGPGGFGHEVPFITPEEAQRAMANTAPHRISDDDFCTDRDTLMPPVDAVLHIGTIPTDPNFSDRDRALFTTVSAVIFNNPDGVLHEYDANTGAIRPSQTIDHKFLRPNFVVMSTIRQPWDFGFLKVRDIYKMVGVKLPNGTLKILRINRSTRSRLVQGVETPKDLRFPLITALNSTRSGFGCFTNSTDPWRQYYFQQHQLGRFSYYNGRFYAAKRLHPIPWQAAGELKGGVPTQVDR